MAGDKEKALTREDVLRLIRENGGKAEGLNLSGKSFVDLIDLSNLNLTGIALNNANLFRANFNGSSLDRAIMRKASLSYATFNSLKSKATSLQSADFRDAQLNDAEFREANLTGAQFGEDNAPPASLDRTDFRGVNLFRANFKNCRFYGTKFERAHIRGSNIPEAHLEEADWGSYVIGQEQSKEDLYFAAPNYRKLKQWYTTIGMYHTAAKFYYREKEANRKSLKWLSKHTFHYRLGLQLSWAVFGYGESWIRLLYWVAGIIFGSAVVYSTLGGLTLLQSLYYSVVSFTALGYGGWVQPHPTGWIQAVGAVESFIGVFIMALLLVTFVRKWTR